MKISIWISLLCWSCCVSAEVITISEKGNDLESCLKNQVPCQSLVDVSKYVTSQQLNNIVIMISDTNYTLQGVANFSGVDNITITGKGHSLTHIYCNNTNPPGAGIVFEKSRNISLSDFTIINCGIFSKKTISYLRRKHVWNIDFKL